MKSDKEDDNEADHHRTLPPYRIITKIPMGMVLDDEYNYFVIHRWCRKNIGDEWDPYTKTGRWWYDPVPSGWCFVNQADAILFSLRWT